MPGVRGCVEPEPSAEARHLETSLRRRFEEDVARIFDESIYSDYELVCGRTKILTHTCILKARTRRVYEKLEALLNHNINRNTYDEIYSFISDVYTECDIQNQEKEILAYLDRVYDTDTKNPNISNKPDVVAEATNSLRPYNKDNSDPEVFLTPKCTTPYTENGRLGTVSSSPSIELNKEYYALVDTNLLEKELKEQDVLSNAFQSIIQTQTEEKKGRKSHIKPTSLPLRSSHSPKTDTHSNDCDFLNKSNVIKNTIRSSEKKVIGKPSSQTKFNTNRLFEATDCKNSEDLSQEKDTAYSPDSLIADDPSSSSDYLSAAYWSPGPCCSSSIPQLDVRHRIKMDSIVTSSDSGLDTNGLLESLNGGKDVTLTDTSLTESTLHDLIADDPSSSSLLPENQVQRFKYDNSQTTSQSGTSAEQDEPQQRRCRKTSNGRRSSKDEKQRQNEEIVILESSSLSSETGSWEPVFPPKYGDKEATAAFLNNERHHYNEIEECQLPRKHKAVVNYNDDLCPSLVQRSPFKNTSCFIDASSLADEDETMRIQNDTIMRTQHDISMINTRQVQDVPPQPSQPVPCSTAKNHDISPNDWSEGHDNDDSLEQLDQKDPDSLQKDLSPTIFEMTPITEDSLCGNTFESAAAAQSECKVLSPPPVQLTQFTDSNTIERKDPFIENTAFVSSTPHNSIMSLRASKLKFNDSDGDSDTTVVNHDGPIRLRKLQKDITYSHSSVSAGTSIEDHLPQVGASHGVLSSACLRNNDSDDSSVASHEGRRIRTVTKHFNHSPIVSGGASVEDHLPQAGSNVSSPLARRKIENVPIVSGAYVRQVDAPKKSPRQPQKQSNASAWVVDMSKPESEQIVALKNESRLSSSHENSSKSRSSLDSDCSEKSSHKFYIDLSTLPDPLPPKTDNTSKSLNEKKNIFSMYIDLGEASVKEKPARLSSSFNAKKTKKENGGKATTDLEANKNKAEATLQFEEIEALCANPDISISEIIALPENGSKTKPDKVNLEILHEETAEKTTYSKNTSKISTKSMETKVHRNNDACMDIFVRLSDLDKPKFNDSSSTIHEHTILDVRMTRSIPDRGWDQAHPTRSNEVISSFHSENALSLNRLFPHLKNEFSRSMPGSLISRTRSPMRAVGSSNGEMDQDSDLSEVSSVQSSYCRSVVENSTTEDSQTSSLIGNCQSKLGQDLLRMFLEEIAPDVVVEVSGRRFRAHKCILSSRCQYFAGILSGGWVESAGNVIVLPPFSYNVVHFALCHIYSGASTIPDAISIVELATIADMLSLEGLKEAIMFTLKAKYCHHFHKPCNVCTAGVLECFPLSSVYGLDDLCRKCLKWITKHFHKVWPTKAFATLPKELLDKCYQQHIVNMSVDKLADTVCGTGLTVASLQSSRWAECVARMCRRLLNAAAHFASTRLLAVVRTVGALPADLPPPAAQALEDCLAAAIEWAPADEACRTYGFLCQTVKQIRSHQNPKPDVVANGDIIGKHSLMWNNANAWRLQCESSIVRSAPRAIDTQAFKELPQELRKRLRELGCIMFGPRSMTSSNPPLNKPQKTQYQVKSRPHPSTRSLDMEHVRASFVPYTIKPQLQPGSTDSVNRKKIASNAPPIRTTKAQEERARYNQAQTHQSQERLAAKTVARPNKFEKTKPRYLESKAPVGKKMSVNRLTVKMVSSSESSRNSSPIQARNLRTSRMKARQPANPGSQAISQDSLATTSRPRTAEPSTESLSESLASNKYATYTKVKHSQGSAESVKTTPRPVRAQVAAKNGVKTKIPVYLNHVRPTEQRKCAPNEATPSKPATNRKVSCSLMMATKSSSAKMVPKINKDTPTKPVAKQRGKKAVKEDPPLPEIPIMDRSGTFLKDEPTFGDKTTDIDIE